jgi:hypothetical protein
MLIDTHTERLFHAAAPRVEPDSEFARLDRVMKNQKRLFFYHVVFTTLMAGGFLASLAAML